ncbi:MAG: FadR family transcriptional regulator [Anaerolineales bacterium]|nr:FadR family transcriptional regulator [Anaerolineales bacterium]
MYTPIHTGRLYEQIVAQIEDRILSGELQPGDKLPAERELAEQFGVSRTAIREAMKALTQRGLVEIYPGRGTFVTHSTSAAVRHSIDLLVKIGHEDGIMDLVEVREILEPEIAALAAIRATEENIAIMQDAVDAMDNAMDDPDTYIEADLDFHLALAQGSDNVLIPVLIDTLVELLREHRKQAANVKGGLERGQPHHKNLLEAIKHRDPDAARTSMRAHLEQIRIDIEYALASKDLEEYEEQL